MKLIKAKYEILKSQGIFKDIEIAGRTCYKSEDKITTDSAEKFVEMLIKRNHTAMLEHGTVYLQIPVIELSYRKYVDNKYSIIRIYSSNGDCYITTNYRVLVENGWLDDLQYQCEPTEFHEKRLSVRFTLDRGISHEFVRHRVFSFAQESSRYCNYSKEQFGGDLTYIIPCWVDNKNEITINNLKFTKELEELHEYFGEEYGNFLYTLKGCESSYFNLLNLGWTPQQARSVLPNSLKTELVMTGTVSQWKGFFKLRCDSAAHPQARELAEPLEQEMIKLNLL